ncbi:response regulator [Thermodesulfobacteriota bacterium]
MIVNNNPDSLTIIEETIASWGFPTLIAADSQKAAKLFKKGAETEQYPGLIIIDEKIGAADGIATMHSLRKKCNKPQLPFLLLTSLPAYNKAAKKCLEIPKCCCLIKPATQRELRQALTNALSTTTPASCSERKDFSPDKIAPGNPLRILLVEDNQINSELALIILEQAGHQVTLAENGIEALKALGKSTYDAVLMDVQMPVLDGLGATALIRQCEQEVPPALMAGHEQLLKKLTKKLKGKHVPIIAMTAHALEDDQKRCLEAGMDKYLSKPFIPEQVIAILNEVTGSPDNPQHPPSPPPTNCQTAAERKQDQTIRKIKIHLASAYHLSPAKINHLLAASSQALTTHLQEAENAITNDDADAVSHTAHTLKGMLLNLGLNNLAELAARIETNQKRQGEVTACTAQFAAIRRELSPLLETFAHFAAKE